MTRRDWLKTCITWSFRGTLAAGIGGIFLDVWLAAGRFSTRHWNQVTTLEALPENRTTAFPRQRVALVHRAGKIGALSLECTHLGCLVNTIDQGFYCPCHGSEFGPDGEVYSGPATRSLPWHSLRISAGKIWVQSGARHTTPTWISLNRQDPRAELRT